jgi:hypothetical protein
MSGFYHLSSGSRFGAKARASELALRWRRGDLQESLWKKFTAMWRDFSSVLAK